jgi:hypothetical protein
MPEYKVTVIDPRGGLSPDVTWRRYRSDVPLEYGDEIVIEADQDASTEAPSSLQVRVTSVDNDAFFTSSVTVEPTGQA